MRPGQQNKRGRGRNNNGGGGGGNNNFNRKGQNPLTRTYDSSGPDVKIRGTAQHIAEKYATLARDAQSAGDRVMAENYLQHAEHYNRIIAAAQSQMQERFQRDDRDGGDDRQDYNERDGEDFDGSDDNTAQGGERSQQQAPQAQPQQQNRQQHERRQREPREPQAQPQPQAEIAGTGPQPVIEDMPAEVAVAAAESQAEAGTERQPRRRNAGNRPRRQPRRSAAGDEGGEGGEGGNGEGGEAPALAEAASE